MAWHYCGRDKKHANTCKVPTCVTCLMIWLYVKLINRMTSARGRFCYSSVWQLSSTKQKMQLVAEIYSGSSFQKNEMLWAHRGEDLCKVPVERTNEARCGWSKWEYRIMLNTEKTTPSKWVLVSQWLALLHSMIMKFVCIQLKQLATSTILLAL